MDIARIKAGARAEPQEPLVKMGLISKASSRFQTKPEDFEVADEDRARVGE